MRPTLASPPTATPADHAAHTAPADPALNKAASRRQVDATIIESWIEPRQSVLDLGCGRGRLLDYLRKTKQIYGVGVDIDPVRVGVCVRKGLTAYQGDVASVLSEFPDNFFDRVVFSRTVEELNDPRSVLLDALRVGRRVAVGFINHGFWRNRLSYLTRGSRGVNPVYNRPWWESRPTNPLSLASFEHFCRSFDIQIHRRIALNADWETPCGFWPAVRAGYLVFDIERQTSAQEPLVAGIF